MTSPPHDPRPDDGAPAAPPRVIIDRRPLGVVLVSRFLREILLVGVLLAFVGALRLEPPEGLSIQGYRCLCVFALVATLWISGAVPLAVTSLFAIASIPILGILPEADAYAYFGSRVIFFILGAFILAAAVMSSGLSTRLAVAFLRRFGSSPARLLAGVFFAGAAGSCFMSEHAVAAMLFPIVTEISTAVRTSDRTYHRAMFLALAWGCIVGGMITVLGGGRAPLAIGILEGQTDGAVTIGFVEYTLYALPLAALLLVVGAGRLVGMARGADADVAPARVLLEERLRGMGRTSLREVAVGIVMIGTVLVWMLRGHEWGLANIAIVSVFVLFLLKLVTWRELEENVNWGVFLMYGGAICLGAALTDSGAASWLTHAVLDRVFVDGTASTVALVLTFAALTMVLTEFMSNSAVIAVVLPPALSIGAEYGIDGRVMTMAVVLPSNFAFMFPMATPATALAYSSGYFRPMDLARKGVGMDLTGLAVFVLVVLAWWPLVMR